MNVNFFKQEIEPILVGFDFKYSYFPEGDFGELNRVEFEGNNKVGTVDFWSKGWVSIDVFDLLLGDQVMNLLLKPNDEKLNAMETLLKVLKQIEGNKS